VLFVLLLFENQVAQNTPQEVQESLGFALLKTNSKQRNISDYIKILAFNSLCSVSGQFEKDVSVRFTAQQEWLTQVVEYTKPLFLDSPRRPFVLEQRDQ